MKKIRLGNDIHVSWEILRNGEPEDFTDKVVEVKLVHAQTFTAVPIEWSIEGNVIEFDFFGKDQKRKGEYRIILTENRGELGMSTLDACEAFYLVDHSCKESDGTKCPTLKVQHVRLTGSFSLSGSVVKPDVSGQIEEHNQDQEAHPFIQNKIAKVVSEALADYIKKETGKGLSTNDFTNELKARLESLTPYDPSELEAEIGKLKTTINTLVSGNASNAIESFNEIIAFLNSVSDTETLEGIIAGIINTVSKIEEKIPTKVSELEDDLSIVTLNDSTPLVESLVGNELIPIKQDGENKAVRADDLIKGGKELFIVTSDMFEQTSTTSELSPVLTFTDEGWSNFIEAAEANKIIALDLIVGGFLLDTATPMGIFRPTGFIVLNSLIISGDVSVFRGYISFPSQGFWTPAIYEITFDNKLVTSSVLINPSQVYYLNVDYYSSAEDFNNLKEAIENSDLIQVIDSSHYGRAVATIANYYEEDNEINIVVATSVPVPPSYKDIGIQPFQYLLRPDGTKTILNQAVVTLNTAGDGTKFLADDGSYKTIDIASILSRLDALEGK